MCVNNLRRPGPLLLMLYRTTFRGVPASVSRAFYAPIALSLQCVMRKWLYRSWYGNTVTTTTVEAWKVALNKSDQSADCWANSFLLHERGSWCTNHQQPRWYKYTGSVLGCSKLGLDNPGLVQNWIQIWKLIIKSKFSLILFVNKLMFRCSMNIRENCPKKWFWTKEKETGVKFNPGLSANRPSNNN